MRGAAQVYERLREARSYVETAKEYEGVSARARHMRAADLAKLMAFGLAHGYVHASEATRKVYDILLGDYENASAHLAEKPGQSAEEVPPQRGPLMQ